MKHSNSPKYNPRRNKFMYMSDVITLTILVGLVCLGGGFAIGMLTNIIGNF